MMQNDLLNQEWVHRLCVREGWWVAPDSFFVKKKITMNPSEGKEIERNEDFHYNPMAK